MPNVTRGALVELATWQPVSQRQTARAESTRQILFARKTSDFWANCEAITLAAGQLPGRRPFTAAWLTLRQKFSFQPAAQ
jgi:hypothetical protein